MAYILPLFRTLVVGKRERGGLVAILFQTVALGDTCDYIRGRGEG